MLDIRSAYSQRGTVDQLLKYVVEVLFFERETDDINLNIRNIEGIEDYRV